jgi:hypothetical protein
VCWIKRAARYYIVTRTPDHSTHHKKEAPHGLFLATYTLEFLCALFESHELAAFLLRLVDVLVHPAMARVKDAFR